MKLNQGPISENSLMEKLVTAKKFMMVMGDTNGNTMVNENTQPNNNYKSSNYEPPTYKNYDEDDISDEEFYNSEQSTPNVNYENKIMKTNLPESIKKVMIENPIAQISLNDTIDMSFTDGAKKLMERQGLINKKPQESKPQSQNINNRDLIKALTPIIENIITKTLDKILEQKLEKVLKAQETVDINENLVLKVGTSIFKGKITEVKKTT